MYRVRLTGAADVRMTRVPDLRGRFSRWRRFSNICELHSYCLLSDVFTFNRFDRHQAVVPRSEWRRFEPLDQAQFRTLFLEVVREASN